MIETILFDLDDTLIVELEWARSGWRLVAEQLASTSGHDVEELERMMATFFALDRAHVFDQLAEFLGLDGHARRACIERYRTTPRPLALAPDARAALEFAAGRRTGIVTDGALATQRAKVEGAGIASRVEVVVYTDALGPGCGKPSPAGFVEALRALGTKPESAIYVGDNAAKDFVGPRALGMRSVQVTRAGGVYEGVAAPAGGEPDVVVASLLELEPVVLGWEAAGALR